MKIIRSVAILALLYSFGVLEIHAQLVSDGGTVVIAGVSTNVVGDLTIGTNGSFTTLVFTNGGNCTNPGNGAIGLNFSAKTNRVVVSGVSSAWNCGGNLSVGYQGSFNLLVVTNGGKVANGNGALSFNGGSAFNAAIVTGPNSIWTNNGNVNIGNNGPSNSVVLTNGGMLESANLVVVGNGQSSNRLDVVAGGMILSDGGRIGGANFATGNVATVSGPGSQWIASSEVDVGFAGTANQLWLTNGGKIYSSGAFVGGSAIQSGTGRSSLLVIAGAGSAWTNYGNFGLGNFSESNQMSILNGGVFRCEGGFLFLPIGTQTASSNNVLLISGTNSLFSSDQGYFYVGEGSSFNRLVVTNGAGLRDGEGYVGSSGNNTAIVTDPGSFWTNKFNLTVGDSAGNNRLTVTNGAWVANQDGMIGNDAAASNNVVIVSGTNSIWTNLGNLYLGNSGPFNQLFVTNSAVVGVRSNLFIGFNASATNNVWTVSSGGVVLATNGGAGTIEVRNGLFTMNSGLVVTDQLLLTNGTQSTFHLTGGTLQTGRTIQGGAGAGGGGVSNPTFVVGGANPAALLQLTGNGVHAFTNGLRIDNNGMLQGNGSIFADVTNASAGTLSPGNSIGALFINGNLMLATGSTNIFELNKTIATNDTVLGISNVTYGGILVISNLSGSLTNGDAFKLFGAASYSGTFASLIPATPGSGLRWSTNGLATDGKLRVATSPTTPPTITSATLSDPAHLLIQASGGVPYEPVYLLSTTNVTVALTNWTYLQTNAFDMSGNCLLPAPFSVAQPTRFFRLQVH